MSISLAHVTAELRQQLASPSWAADQQFHTFDALMATFPELTNVFRVRKALAPLIQEGLLVSLQGSGTYVGKRPGASKPDVAALLGELEADTKSLLGKIAAVRQVVGAAA